MTGDAMTGPWPGRWNWAFAAGKGRRHPREDHLERLEAIRQWRGGRRFGPGPMFGPPFGGGRGRKRRGDVRTAVLLLLDEEPRNGYQLMQTIEERSGGRWRPSPGSVYPTLAQLEDEGLVRSVEQTGGRVFEITDAGREQLAGRADAAPPWEAGDDPAWQAADDIGSLVMQIHVAAMQVAQAGDQRQIEQASERLSETRRALYGILAEEGDR
jgi:DNA-binding PadR family transcriptional regulator